MLGFSTVAHSVEKRYGFRGLDGDSGSGVGKSCVRCLADFGSIDGAMYVEIFIPLCF
jgi:hypothetical protein